jgi:hypothetical protein
MATRMPLVPKCVNTKPQYWHYFTTNGHFDTTILHLDDHDNATIL